MPGVWPDWIRGRVVEETSTGLGTSTVKINLPVLTEEQRNDFQTFEVEWRRLGESSWEKTTTSTTSSSVDLPGELPDGSYEVRVRATGTGGTTLYTTPIRFPLRALGKTAPPSPGLILRQDPLDLSFWSFLTFLHHGIEEVEMHLL